VNAMQIVECYSRPRLVTLRRLCQNREAGRPKISLVDAAAIERSRLSPGLVNCLLCVSLWLSLIAAIWMSRGWIGLLFSGQLLSAGVSLIQKLAHKTQYAFVRCSGSLGGWEEQRRG